MLEKFDTFAVASTFYRRCKTQKLPRFMQDQHLCASSSIALNLAEGSAKRTPQDQRRFYTMAFGGLRECQAIIELEEINDQGLNQLANRLGEMLFRVSRKSVSKD